MSGWLNQLQSMLGQKTSGSGDQGLSKLLVPGALGGLAGLLVANKSSRKLLAKYGTGALLAGGGAIAGTVLWNKYKDRYARRTRMNPTLGGDFAAGSAYGAAHSCAGVCRKKRRAY